MVIDLYIKGKNNTVIVCTDDDCLVNMTYQHSNNMCEWEAICSALTLLSKSLGQTNNEFNVNIDSKLIISQLYGKVPSDFIEPFEDCKSQRIKSKNLKSVYFSWNKMYNLLKRKYIINYKYIEPQYNLARKWLK